MTREQMDEYLSHYPRSNTHRIYTDEEQNSTRETVNEVFSATFNSPLNDEDILALVHAWIVDKQCQHTGTHMYVRVEPEIEQKERCKQVYCRIQFAE